MQHLLMTHQLNGYLAPMQLAMIWDEGSVSTAVEAMRIAIAACVVLLPDSAIDHVTAPVSYTV